MDRYWLKIGVGAFAVFAVGFAAWSAVEPRVRGIRDLAHSDAEISIPLFGMVPFTVEGRRSGRIDRITILRDAPRQIAGVVVRVGRGDSLPGDAFEGCSFTVKDPTNFEQDPEFLCLKDPAALAGLEGFGEVRIETADGIVVREILLPPEAIREFRDPENYDAYVQAAEGREAEAQRLADSIGEAMAGFGDSIAAAATAKAESATAEAQRRAAEARARARKVEASSRRGAGGAAVEVTP